MYQFNKTIQSRLTLIVLQKKTKGHSLNSPQISDYTNRILITGSSESGKTNALLNLINHKLYTDKNYLYAKGPHKAKYQFLSNKCQCADVKHYNDSKALLNARMILIIFMKILKNPIQIWNVKYYCL